MPFECTYVKLLVDTIEVHTIVTQKLHDVHPPDTRLWNQNSKFVEKSKKSQFEILRGFTTKKQLKYHKNHDFSTAVHIMTSYGMRNCATDLKLIFRDNLCILRLWPKNHARATSRACVSAIFNFQIAIFSIFRQILSFGSKVLFLGDARHVTFV